MSVWPPPSSPFPSRSLIEFRITNHARIETSADCVAESNNSNFGRRERSKIRKDRRKIGRPAGGQGGQHRPSDKCTPRCLAVSFERNGRRIELVGRISAETGNVAAGNCRDGWTRRSDGFARSASKAAEEAEESHRRRQRRPRLRAVVAVVVASVWSRRRKLEEATVIDARPIRDDWTVFFCLFSLPLGCALARVSRKGPS